jgi:hypothetical protein
MNAAVTTATAGAVVAAERLVDWASMAAGAFPGEYAAGVASGLGDLRCEG